MCDILTQLSRGMIEISDVEKNLIKNQNSPHSVVFTLSVSNDASVDTLDQSITHLNFDTSIALSVNDAFAINVFLPSVIADDRCEQTLKRKSASFVTTSLHFSPFRRVSQGKLSSCFHAKCRANTSESTG